MQRAFAVALTAGALLWVAALVLAPFQFSGGSVLAAIFYDACGVICHQRPERSFHLSGVQMPVCARCFGLYASGAAGALLAWITPRTPNSSAASRRLLLLAASPTIATLLIEWSGLARPGSGVRALAATSLGAALGWLLVRTLDADSRAAVAAGHMRYHA